MLLDAMISGLKRKFPDLIFIINPEENLISIPSENENVGNLEIVDEGDELTIYLGQFTHWHAGWYEEGKSQESIEKEIVEEVVEYLKDLFNDKIVMWGSHEEGGGSYHLDFEEAEQDAPLDDHSEKKYVWSGREIS